MYEFRYLPTPNLIGVTKENHIANKIINIMNKHLEHEADGNYYFLQIEEVMLHGRNTLDAYSDIPVYVGSDMHGHTSSFPSETFKECTDAHKEVIKELTSYFRDNKIYGLDITKNIILNVTFLVTSDGLSHTPINAIYIIQGQ